MRLPTVVVRGDVLVSWVTISGYTRSRLASELGVSRGRVSQLLTSQQEPSAHLMGKLMQLTHLPFERLFKTVSRGQGNSGQISARQISARRIRRITVPAPKLAHLEKVVQSRA